MSALVLALLGALQGAGDTPAPSEPASLGALVAELDALRTGAGAEEVARRIRGLGAAVPELVLAAWSREELPAQDGGALVLGAEERRALLLAASALGRGAFVPAWSAAAGSSDPGLRRATIELVGELGSAGDLPLALRAATPPDARALELAATALLARDERTPTALRGAILGSHPELAAGLIRAVGAVPDGRTVGFLEELLGKDPHLDLPLLSQIERVARGVLPPLDEHVGRRVRPYLSDPDRQLARGAALCLAALRDDGSLEDLVALSASADRALADAAFLALERTTGLELPRRSERWRVWLEAERTWQREQGARLDAALASRDVAQVLSALREHAAHRVGRAYTARAIAPLLEHDDPRVRAQARATLEALGATWITERRDAAPGRELEWGEDARAASRDQLESLDRRAER